MKKLIFILTVVLFIITSCTGVKSVSKGIESQAFLELVSSSGKYSDGVNVIVDDNINFKAIVGKGNSKRPKGKVYAISPGKHIIKVEHNNNLIYSKQVFVSDQETKQIILP